MRGSIAQPWSKTPSRTKGTSRNLGDLAFGRAVIHVAGPHGEGDEPKPMMHEREKSDSAVVAVKSTNEAGRPAEEWMEPRAGAKGNVGRSITLRTQCRAGVSHALGHIRYALQFAAKPSNTRGGSRMRESRTSGFVRGAHSNMCPYRDIMSPYPLPFPSPSPCPLGNGARLKCYAAGLIWQSECIHCVGSCRDDVLFPIYSVAHRAAPHSFQRRPRSHATAACPFPHRVPQRCRPPTPEHHSAGSGEHAALGVVGHLEFPLLLSGLRIKGENGAVSFGLGLVLRNSHAITCPESAGRGGAGGQSAGGAVSPKPGHQMLPVYKSPSLPWTNGPFAVKIFASFARSLDRRALFGGRKMVDNSSCPLANLAQREFRSPVSASTLPLESAGHHYRCLSPKSL